MKTITTILLLLLSGLVFSQVNLDSGLVAFYPFNGNCNDIKGGHHGTGSNLIPAIDRFGYPNKTYGFNGVNSVVKIPHSSNFNFDANVNSYSVVVWVKSTLPNLDSTLSARVIEKWIGTLINPYPFSWQVKSAGANAYISRGDSAIKTAFGSVWDGQWHCLVHVVNATNDEIRVYVDGNLISTSTNIFSTTTGNQDTIYIGNSYLNTRPYQGLIDDVRLYNRALNPEEILALNSFGSATDEFATTEIQLFPNPTSDAFNLNFGNHGFSGEVEIYDAIGQLLYSRVLSDVNHYSVETDFLPAGVYFIRLNDYNKGSSLLKVVKQ